MSVKKWLVGNQVVIILTIIIVALYLLFIFVCRELDHEITQNREYQKLVQEMFRAIEFRQEEGTSLSKNKIIIWKLRFKEIEKIKGECKS